MTNKPSGGSQSFGDDKDWLPFQQTPKESPPPSYESQITENDLKKSEMKLSWRSLFAFTTRQHVGHIASALLASIFAGLVKPIQAIIFGMLFNALTDYGAGNIDADKMLHEMSKWCLALTGLGIATWILEGLFFSLWMIFGELQAKSLRQRMFSGMLDKSMEWYDLREDGIASLLSRIETQVRELQLAVSQPLGFLILEIVASLSSIGTALYFSWKLALVIFATFPLAAAVLGLVSKGVGPAIERQKRELSRASKYANTAVAAIDTVKAFNGQDQEVWQYLSTTKAITNYYLIQARCNAFQWGIIKFSAVALYVTAFWYGLYLVTHGLTVGRVLTTFQACASAMQSVELVLPQFLVLSKGISAGETLKSIMAEMQDGRNSKSEDGDLKPETCSGDIEINNVSFVYPSNPKQNVLNKATFFFPAGETTYLVGRSGSGKSTIGNLLLKYYKPLSGEILIDGEPIETLCTDWVRQNVMLVQQQSVLFNETVLQNIKFGTPEPTTTNDACQAVRDACLEQTIDEMPKGFDTMIGPKNRALSGGQGQRVAIARARLRDAPILILDESTSALDQTSRMEVMNKIRLWRRGKTTIFITHDVSQILHSDYVYVLQDGRVAQEGYRKILAEKSHGLFASFLRGAESDEPPPSQLPGGPSTQSFDCILPPQESNTRWSHISSLFSGRNSPSNSGGQSFGLSGTRLSVSPAIVQANALREGTIWSTPVIPDSPVMENHQRLSVPLMPFMSPRPSPQVPSPVFQSSVHRDKFHHTPTVGNHLDSIHQPSLPAVEESKRQLDAYIIAKSAREQHHDIEPQNAVDEKPASLSIIFRSVWPALTCRERIFLVLGLLAALVVGGATPAFAWVFAQLLKTFYTPEDRIELARKWALTMLAIAIVDGSACYCSHYFLEYSGQAWINSLRVESLRRIIAQPKSWFDKERNSPSRLTECLDREAEEMRNLLGRFVGIALTIVTMLLISVVWAFIVNWTLTAVSLSSAPAMYAITRLYHWSSGKWESKCNQSSEFTSSIFSETFSHIRVVRALLLERYFEYKHDNAIAESYKIGKARAMISGCMFGLTDSLIYYIVALVFYYGTVIVASGHATVTTIFVVMGLLLLGSGNAIGMFALIPQLNSSRATATQVLHLANLPLDKSHESQGTKRLATPFPIKFDRLSFTYPSTPQIKTLDSISLTITPGSCTAIVGPSGSGKSTIASLLLGLYPPSAAPGLFSPPTLTFAGKSILDCNIHNLRSHMSIVSQTPLLFPATIFANITYGLSESSHFNTYLAVEHAAIDAGIHDFISSLENGYNTLIGEGGMGLSGGQAQRITVARSLIRRPKVLILDEATSALDVESAAGIRDTVKRLKGNAGMAVVVISHNVDMMRIADTVVMIENGKVVEQGGFDELRARGGAFEGLITGEVRRPVVRSDTALSLGVRVEERFMTPVKPRTKMEWSRN